MARYIDADMAYETARMFNSDFGKSMADLTSLREVLEDTPTADVVKVKHGKWIKGYEKAPRYVCSVCHHLYNNKEYKHCPFCGAKMDGTPKEREVNV